MLHRRIPFLLLLPALLCFLPRDLTAQQPARDGWDSERARALLQRAQEQRRKAVAPDTGLLNYQADARGYVYFFLDRQDTGEHHLVKTDQIALEIFWQAPGQVKQRIVGWRDRMELPAHRLHYYLDRLTVVQDNYRNNIVIADGENVNNVLHPAAPGAESFYSYRLADSLVLRLPGAPEPIRVFELQVRPRDMNQAAVIGSLFIDPRQGDLVRMNFTFTPAAYVENRLDYINVSLENGLWEGRFWLPHEQRLEIRRQIPELDFPVGTLIRTRMRIGNYRINEELPPSTFAGPTVVAVPRAERESFPFEQELYADLREQGVRTQTDLQEIRRQAAQLARQRALSGLPRVRLRLGEASELFRYNRAEGAAVGLGLSYYPSPTTAARLRGGWAFGAGHPLAETGIEWDHGTLRLGASGYANRARDVGIGPVASGAANTVMALVAGQDYLDPFYASGAELQARWGVAPEWSLTGSLRAERHRSAAREVGFSLFGGTEAFRPVQSIDEGTLLGGTLGIGRATSPWLARGWSASLQSDFGTLDPAAGSAETGSLAFARAQAELGWGRRWDAGQAELELRGTTGLAWGELPRQQLFLLGGRGTLPGYDFRTFGGDRFVLGQATFSTELQHPWLRGRLLGAAGWTGSGRAAERALELWGATPTDGIRGSAGAGLGIFHDILRLDLGRGLGPGGDWELILEARRSFWGFL